MLLFQFVNLLVFLLVVLYQFIPWIWIVFLLILWEGLLGGAAYVNTFYKVSNEVKQRIIYEYQPLNFIYGHFINTTVESR